MDTHLCTQFEVSPKVIESATYKFIYFIYFHSKTSSQKKNEIEYSIQLYTSKVIQ